MPLRKGEMRLLLYRIMVLMEDKIRGRRAMKWYAKNGWISPWYYRVTWKDKLPSKRIIDESAVRFPPR